MVFVFSGFLSGLHNLISLLPEILSVTSMLKNLKALYI